MYEKLLNKELSLWINKLTPAKKNLHVHKKESSLGSKGLPPNLRFLEGSDKKNLQQQQQENNNNNKYSKCLIYSEFFCQQQKWGEIKLPPAAL